MLESYETVLPTLGNNRHEDRARATEVIQALRNDDDVTNFILQRDEKRQA